MLFRSDGWVKTVLGQAVVGAQVYVCTQPANLVNPPTPLASIFADPLGNAPITQPVPTDGFGHYDFYVAYGTYTVVIVNTGQIQVSYPDQTIGYPALVAGVSSVFGRTGVVVALGADYSAFYDPFGAASAAQAASDPLGSAAAALSASELFTTSAIGALVLPSTKAAVTSKWLNSYTASTGVFTQTQPSFSDISGTVSLGQLPSGIPTGTLEMATAAGSIPSPLFSVSLAIQSIAAANSTYTLTQAINLGSIVEYVGTFPNGANNALVGNYFTIAGFTNAGNNNSDAYGGQVIASSATFIKIYSSTAVNETHAATATSAQSITTVTIPSTTQCVDNGAQGCIVVISGASNSANNGTWVCTGSNATTLNLNNANGVLQASAVGVAVLQDDLMGTGINPQIYVQDSNGYWHGQAGMDITTPADGSGVEGTFTFGRRIYIRDNNLPYQQQDPNGNEYGTNPTNSLITVNHIAGRGTTLINQDRAIWVSMTNDQNNDSPIYGMECLQMEMDLAGTINLIAGVPPDAEMSVLSLQMADSHIGNTSVSGGAGANCIRATYFREPGAGMWTNSNVPETVARFNWLNNSSVDGAGQAATGLYVDVEGGGVNIGGYGIYVTNNAGHGGRLPNFNIGLFIDNYGTNVSDWAIQSGNGQVGFGGPVGVASLFCWGPNTTTIAVNGGISPASVITTQVGTPGEPDVTNFGATGSTTYAYVAVFYDANGNPTAASPAGSTNTGNATLSATNGNLVDLGYPTLSGAASWAVYRTIGGPTQGKIASGGFKARDYATLIQQLVFDTGLVADGTTAPTVNSTGSIVAVGPISAGQFTVANLPSGVEGQMVYATNGLKIGESTGSGTGVPCYYSARGPAGAGWYVFSAATHVAS